jgi:hypothetical protein
MVESSPYKYNFLKLSASELVNKLTQAKTNSTRVVFWKQSPRFFEGRISDSHFQNGELHFSLKFDFLSLNLTELSICLNFSLNEVEYFLKAKVIKQFDTENIITLKLEGDAFRVEKRLFERLITYPNYQVFLYVRFQKLVNESNVIFFDKKESKENEFLKSLSSNQSIFSENDDEEILGLRVEDINSKGLAAIVSQKEYENIILPLKSKPINATLMLEAKSFTLNELKVVYDVDYISTSFQVKMKKVGFSFKQSPSIKRAIEDLTGATLDLEDYRSEFEEFIKNE